MNTRLKKFIKIFAFFILYYLLGVLILSALFIFESTGGSYSPGPFDFRPSPRTTQEALNLIFSLKIFWLGVLIWPLVLIYFIILYLDKIVMPLRM
jgi:hypothetical protein